MTPHQHSGFCYTGKTGKVRRGKKSASERHTDATEPSISPMNTSGDAPVAEDRAGGEAALAVGEVSAVAEGGPVPPKKRRGRPPKAPSAAPKGS